MRYVVNSPQLHIWHHAADYRERGNVNFGDALIIWDFVFGTAYRRTPGARYIRYPSKAQPEPNDQEIRIILDPKLGSGIEDLDE